MAKEVSGDLWVVDLALTDELLGLMLDADILVNNAGVQHVAPVEEFPPEQFSLIAAAHARGARS